MPKLLFAFLPFLCVHVMHVCVMRACVCVYECKSVSTHEVWVCVPEGP